MAADENIPTPTHVDVVCPICRARLHPRVKRSEYSVKCPDCFVPVRVPPLNDVVAKLKERQRLEKREAVGTYGLSNPEQPARELPKSVTVVCRQCQARLDPPLQAKPRRIQCPDCHCPLEVPSLEEVRRAELRRKKKQRKRPDVGQYDVGTAPETIRPSTFYLDKQAEIRREPIPTPPGSTFFSGTFTFPWQPGTRQRWIYMSIGWTAAGLITAFIFTLYASLGVGSGLGLAFFALPAIWIGFTTAAYTAACFVPIVIETSAGGDRIDGWPDPVWKEWAVQLIYISFILMETMVAAYGVARLTHLLTGWYWWPMVAFTHISFPIILTSSLEANSTFVPLSPAIIRSLFRSARWWLGFYLITGVMFFAFVQLIWGIVWLLPQLAMIVPGPLFAAMILIYARLLGRLGWRASLESPELPNDVV